MRGHICPQCNKLRMVRPLDHVVSLTKHIYKTTAGVEVELYIDICENPDDYTNVLDPYTWTYNAKKYSHRGLKCVLANFVATRQHQSSASVSTPFGEMLPNSEFSTRAPEKEIARKAALTQSKALSYWEDVKLFLIHNSTTYPLFDQCETNESQSIRVTAIGGGYSSLSKHNKYNW